MCRGFRLVGWLRGGGVGVRVCRGLGLLKGRRGVCVLVKGRRGGCAVGWGETCTYALTRIHRAPPLTHTHPSCPSPLSLTHTDTQYTHIPSSSRYPMMLSVATGSTAEMSAPKMRASRGLEASTGRSPSFFGDVCVCVYECMQEGANGWMDGWMNDRIATKRKEEWGKAG